MTDGFAIIGTAARLPRANGPAEFWRLLRSGTDAVTDPPRGGRPRGVVRSSTTSPASTPVSSASSPGRPPPWTRTSG